MEHTLSVRMLGEFNLSYDGTAVNESASRSRKVWLFLAYLIYHRQRMVPKEELLQLLDADGRNTDPVRMLRNVRWNARKVVEPLVSALGAELVLTRGSDCQWNPAVDTWLDVEEFESCLDQAEPPAAAQQRETLLRRAIDLYRGDFLEKLSGETWVSQLSAYFQNRYLDLVSDAIPILHAAGDYLPAAELCRSAMRIAPYHEPLHRELMCSLIGAGDYAGADAAYKSLRDLLLSELGVMPDQETQAIHQEILRHVEVNSVSPDDIRDRLREQALPTGALICDYATFRLFYQVEARSADRRGDAIHIGILSVTGKNGKALTEKNLERVMDQLREQIQATLRIGDVAACCSASQYILLLVQANFENSQMVCDRVVKAFASAHPRSGAEILSSVLPLEPLFTE